MKKPTTARDDSIKSQVAKYVKYVIDGTQHQSYAVAHSQAQFYNSTVVTGL